MAGELVIQDSVKFWAWEGYNNGGGVKNMRERERERIESSKNWIVFQAQ